MARSRRWWRSAARDPGPRLAELRRGATLRAEAGRSPIRVAGFPSTGHNLMRYRPADVAAAILAAADPSTG